MIKGKMISILIDRSTHSFTDGRLVGELNYATNETKSVTLKIANGEKLDCKTVSTTYMEST